jgi:potassium-transporting ATPase KdpC subunit
MKKALLPALSSVLVLTVLLGVLYPLAIAGIGQGVFPGNAYGQQIHLDGKLVGSRIIGQQFTDVVRTRSGAVKKDSDGNPVTVPDRRYFQTRPSGTVPADNDAATAFANLGPNDRATAEAITANVKAYLALNRPYDPRLTEAQIPVDAVDTSASGVDPDISVANAGIQAHRVAAVRHLSLPTVMSLVRQNTSGRALGFSGEPSVNVLQLNLALDRASSHAQGQS